MYQKINQSINLSPNYQSINLTGCQPVNQQINQHITQSSYQPVNQLVQEKEKDQ